MSPAPSSFESELFRLINDWTGQSVSYESISVCSNLSVKHADNIFFPGVRELLKRRTDHFLVFGGSIYIWVRNTMTTKRLSDVAVSTMHANTVTIDRRLVYEKFVALLPRRIMASSLFANLQVDSNSKPAILFVRPVESVFLHYGWHDILPLSVHFFYFVGLLEFVVTVASSN